MERIESAFVNMKRMKRQITGPANPLFEEWLIAWQKEAIEQNSELQHTLGRALRSLRKYPFPLLSGKECIILDNFGKKICEMIDKKLEEYRKMFTDEEWKELISGSMKTKLLNNGKGDAASSSSKRRKANENKSSNGSAEKESIGSYSQSAPVENGRKNPYVPKFRSGAYAILITLYNSSDDLMTKGEIEADGQDLCDSSFTQRQSGSHYTAWSSMATLIRRELVVKTPKPIRYHLTDNGRALAEHLANNISATASEVQCPTNPRNKPSSFNSQRGNVIVAEEETHNDSESSSLHSRQLMCGTSSTQNSSSELEPCSQISIEDTILLLPGRFEIILLIDIRETDLKCKNRLDSTVRGLQQQRIKCETRHLAVGDFAWICRDRLTSAELVLPYVLERKRLDDLAGSIKDGRFHEQKFRLKQCGLSNIIYLIEQCGKDVQRLGLPLANLQQAASNTQLVDKFMVMYTCSHDESLLYISCVTKQLVKMFKDKTLMGCSKSELGVFNPFQDVLHLIAFPEFNRSSTKVKNWTLKEMMVKHLVQLKGLSVEKATAITEKYPTPTALKEAFQKYGEKAITDISAGPLRRVGPAIAKTVCALYTESILS